MRPPALLSTAVLLSLAMTAVAQGNDNNNNDGGLPNLNTAQQPGTADPASSQAKSTGAANTGKTTGAADTGKTTGASATGKSTAAGKTTAGGTSKGPSPTSPPASSSSNNPGGVTISGGATASDSGPLPGLSTALPKLPTLPAADGGFTIPVMSVPPTANAPYMQTSTMPEGTVFIAVGAILGFMALAVLLWRGMVVWALHRSVKRAALHQNLADTKAMLHAPAAPLYKYSDHESTISLSGLGPKSNRKSMRPTTAGGTPSRSDLFFSPTAGAATAGLNTAGNRGSNYLPAGYYAAGAAQPGNGTGMTHLNADNHRSINLSNIAAQSQGYQRARSMGTTPPDSPRLGMSRHVASSSTVNLSVPPGDRRTPSTYLEDLFDGEGGNPPLPPPHQGRI